LNPPPAPAAPGAYDFGRNAWFQGLGGSAFALGETRPAVLPDPPWRLALEMRVNAARFRLAQAIVARLGERTGGVAAAMTTGHETWIMPEDVQTMRDSGLAHILSISGLHMAIVGGFVFFAVRLGVALVPWLALRVSGKKVAAWAGLIAVGTYLIVSGAPPPAERAAITASIAFLAILLDRQAISMHALAVAAFAVLILQPEAVVTPGFQMSFAATIALIRGFAALDGSIYRERVPRWLMPVFTLVLSSLIGGLSTAPYAAAHFNRFTDYGLLANLLTVPVMGAVIMPAGAVAALLAPFGLAGLPLWVMEQGARWILFVAHWTAGLDGSVTAIPAPGPWVLPMFTLGALWLILWRGRMQLAGALPVLAALGLWLAADRPLLLVSGDGRLLGLEGPEGRALSAAKGGGFAAENWLQNDGDLTEQALAAERPGFDGPKGERWFDLAGLHAVALSGKGAETKLAEVCRSAGLVVLAAEAGAAPENCPLIDAKTLSATGALALWQEGDSLRIEATKGAQRLWSPPARAFSLPDLSGKAPELATQ